MKRILVIDDSPLVRSALRACLRAEGYDVLEADDGAAGLETITREGSSLDLAIVDVNMPELDGLSMIEQARQAGFVAPMITLTTESSRNLRDRARAVGATGWLTKPVDAPDLVATVRYLLG
ncbi:MAG: response regulator [Myxococcota bacterium]